MKRVSPIAIPLLAFSLTLCPVLAAPLTPAGVAAEKAGAPSFKLTSGEVSAPLYTEAGAGINALANVQVKATVSASTTVLPIGIYFNGNLGASGKTLATTVTTLLKTQHGGWPSGQHIEITFSPTIAADDAPAAALATALLLDSMLRGSETDPACAIIGGLRADGKVFGATSALMRLTTASRGQATRIIMPEKNVTEAADCMVNEGVAGAGRVQMFAVKDFEEILQMATLTIDPDMAKAMTAFADVQKEFSKAGADADALLKDPDNLESLRTVLRTWPSHMSARLLLGRSSGRYKTFSLGSSIEVTDRIAATLRKGISAARPYDIKALPPEKITEEVGKLRMALTRVDPQAQSYLNAIIRYGDTARAWNTRPAHTPLELEEFMSAMSGAAGQALDLRSRAAALIQAAIK